MFVYSQFPTGPCCQLMGSSVLVDSYWFSLTVLRRELPCTLMVLFCGKNYRYYLLNNRLNII